MLQNRQLLGKTWEHNSKNFRLSASRVRDEEARQDI